MMMRTKLIIIGFCALILGLLPAAESFALPLESLLPDVQVKQLLQSGAIDRERFDTTSFGMVPRFDVLERL
ncbi:MAG: hypothetical protein FWG07_01880, partial [Treponema sp.]|nr:hypothetical protein [Treponema sp.]